MKLLIVALALVANLCYAETTLYLLRHAEKINSTNKDPGLTAIGQFRAKNIAKQLKPAHIKSIYSTNYKRTRQTAEPLAKQLGIIIKEYNPRKLTIFADKLKSLKYNAMVVGHSNTTTQLVQLLSGQTVESIKEDEYDNLYEITFSDQGVVLVQSITAPSTRLDKH
jgi:broad specificity phosphatase PhoE